MLHILLLVLKIIGILVLALLVLFLLCVCLVLFASVHYRMQLEKKAEDSWKMDVRVTWLLRLLSIRVKYEESLDVCFRILGIPIKKFQEPMTEDTSKEAASKENANETKPDRTTYKGEQTSLSVSQEEKSKVTLQKQEEPSLQKKQEVSKTEQDEELQTVQKIADEQNDKEMFTDKTSSEHKITGTSFWQRQKDKVTKWYECVKAMWFSIRQKKENVIEEITNVTSFCSLPENRAGVTALLEGGKKIFRHIWPKKWKGQIRFGMEDPAKTGKILGILAVLFGVIGTFPEIEPDFQEAVLEGELWAKGRLRIGVLLWIVFQVWRNENVKKLKNNFEKIRRV